jgi:molybdate transport system ATP-binding protein
LAGDLGLATLLDVEIRARLGEFRLAAAFSTDEAPVTALFGRSGAGKSSVIAAVAGLLRPDSGRVELDGRVLFDSTHRVAIPASQRRIGVVFQETRLFPHMSVRANLLYGWRRRVGAARDPSGPKLAAVIEPLGIGSLLDRRPSTLSGGERQRVAIGRAVLANPRLLLMDEPLASLDGERKAELLPLLAKLPRVFRIPIVYVSHAVDEVLRLADRMVLLDDGRVVAAGPVEEVANRPEFGRIAAQESGPDSFTVISATIVTHDSAGQTHLSFGGGALSVPRVSGEAGDRVRLRVAASEVILALAPPVGLSVRNVIPARIAGIQDIGGLVEVTLEAGGPLRARISRAARAELGLAPGLAVYALIKSTALAPGQRG